MSKPQYMRKQPSVYSITNIAVDVCRYMYTITGNDKNFPKPFRHTLGNDIRTQCLNICKNVDIAYSIKPRHRKELKRRIKYQQRVYEHISYLKTLIQIGIKFNAFKNVSFVADLFTKLDDSFLRWIKNDRKTYRNLPSHKEYIKKQKQWMEEQAYYRELNKNTKYDEEGFIILTKI